MDKVYREQYPRDHWGEAAKIAALFPDGGDFGPLGVCQVAELLFRLEPIFHSAEAAYARRWAYAEEMKSKSGKPSHRLSKYKGELQQDLYSHIRFTRRGTAAPPLSLGVDTDHPEYRPMSRDPLRAIEPEIRDFAKSHGFKHQDTRVYDEEIGLPPMEMTDIKRLCLKVSQFFWPLYTQSHWMAD